MAWNENRWEGSSTVTIRVCQTPVTATYIQFYKTFLSLIYKFSIEARVFAPGKPFQPGLMFSGKAIAYPSEAPFRCNTKG
jgi:hypothetical protein